MNNALIIVIGFLGTLLIGAFVAITLLVPGDKTIAYVGLGAVAGLFVPQLMTFKSSSDNAAKLEAVKQDVRENTVVTTEAKKDNAHAIEIVTMKQDQTNGMVDGHLSSLTTKLDTMAERIVSMAAQIAGLEQEKVTKAAETAKLVDALASSAPAGSTPPHGTPTTIIAGAPTTIVADIAPPAKSKKRPGPGEHQ